MEQDKRMHFVSRKNSFVHALSGLRELFRQEPNARIHTIAAIAVIIAGIARHIAPLQWIALVFAIGLVFVTEALNTCIEKLCNIWCKNEWHPEVKIIKDIAAGAVLVAAAVSAVIGVFVFFFCN